MIAPPGAASYHHLSPLNKATDRMRISSYMIMVATFAAAAVICLVAAVFSVRLIEVNSKGAVQSALRNAGLNWAEVYAEGLNVFIAGTAPSEAMRFKAISLAGGEVDAARVIDNMGVAASEGIAPPRFSIEILRNDAGVSLIGLIPAQTDRDDIARRLRKLSQPGALSDLLETADYDVPGGWDAALGYALGALKSLPRSKISVSAGQVAITAMAPSAEKKQALEAELTRKLPSSVKLTLDISAPRPVIAPFTLRYVLDAQGGRFDACSADSPQARERIIAAARAAGLNGEADCTIGLGVPAPSWAEAAETAIKGLAELGAGSVTFADADVFLQATEDTNQAVFDRVVGEMESDLPDLFALKSDLPRSQSQTEDGAPEFVATLSPEGLVQIRGRLRSELTREAAQSFAHARFGSDSTYMAARLDDTLPDTWPVRVLAGLDALSRLNNGALTVTAESLTLRGNTGNPEGRAEVARVLVEKLGEQASFDIDVTYVEKLDPVAALPSPETCASEIRLILSERQIQFKPGEATIDDSAAGIMDDIADILRQCGEIRLEIQGHTDSQGREEMNLQLSQSRAQSVLNELQARRVLTSSFTAKGYGEAEPIADNDTEEGRVANRRIEFVLIRPAPTQEELTTLESAEQQAEDAGADAQADSAAEE